MMHRTSLADEKHAGEFILPNGAIVYGELKVNGESTELYLRSKEYFDTRSLSGKHINGILHDLRRVSLVNCVPIMGTGHAMAEGETYYFAHLFAHYVTEGRAHLAERGILSASFTFDDATTLFYDFDAFGMVLKASGIIKTVVLASNLGREVKTGPNPKVAYFTGRAKIAQVSVADMSISVNHSPSYGIGGPNGVQMNNKILIDIKFKRLVNIYVAVDSIIRILQFCSLLVGRPQNLPSFYVMIKQNGVRHPLQVHWSLPPQREREGDERRPHVADILINAVDDPKQFQEVLGGWLSRQHAWSTARSGFFRCFDKEDRYDVDRLIAAANMFDVLPPTALPESIELDPKLVEARDDAKALFRALPQSLERDSVLNALGRVGTITLKRKVRYHAARIIEAAESRFPDLHFVADEAINCRNFYVHGSPGRIDYERESWVINFFTNTLEFIFGTSDLIESGWKMQEWCDQGSVLAHPFAGYKISYKDELKRLNGLLTTRSQ